MCADVHLHLCAYVCACVCDKLIKGVWIAIFSVSLGEI